MKEEKLKFNMKGRTKNTSQTMKLKKQKKRKLHRTKINKNEIK